MKLNLLEKLKNWIEYFNEDRNPLMPYWKVRKIFKRPKCHFMCGTKIWFFGLVLRQHLSPIFSFRTSALGWKWKYDEVRHEWDPYIYICLFRKYQFIWIFNWANKHDFESSVKSMATWEAILDYLYNKKTIEQVIKLHQWGSSVEGGPNITINDNIK